MSRYYDALNNLNTQLPKIRTHGGLSGQGLNVDLIATENLGEEGWNDQKLQQQERKALDEILTQGPILTLVRSPITCFVCRGSDHPGVNNVEQSAAHQERDKRRPGIH